MEVRWGLEAFLAGTRPVVVSIGNFDGLHAGHQAILRRLTAVAHERGAQAWMFTFKPHPIEVLRPEMAPPVLTTLERRIELAGQLGVEGCLVCRTDRALLEMTARQFFLEVVRGRLGALGLVEGPNFRFGCGRQGDVALMRAWATEVGMFLEMVPPVELAGGVVSSTRIRELLIEGRVADAAQLLTRPHRITGRVVVGKRRGRSLGFPTANLEAIEQILPAQGIYAVTAVWKGRLWPGALHLGPRPTFRTDHITVEVHLIGFEGDLYGQELAVDFHARLRDVIGFDGPEALCRQMAEDVRQARRLLASQGVLQADGLESA